MVSLDLSRLKWSDSPNHVDFNAGIVMADVAINKNETLTLYTTEEGAELIKQGKLDLYSDLVDYAHPMIRMQALLKSIEQACLDGDLEDARCMANNMTPLTMELSNNLTKMMTTRLEKSLKNKP